MLPRGSITAGSTLGPGALRPAGIPTFTRSERVPWREWVWAETRPMRRNYLSKEKGAEVFPERGHTHKGLGVLRREGLQRQPEAKWHGSCINWQRSEAALKAWMRMTPSDFFGCGGGEWTSVQVQASQQGHWSVWESSGAAAPGITGGLVSRRLTRSPWLVHSNDKPRLRGSWRGGGVCTGYRFLAIWGSV